MDLICFYLIYICMMQEMFVEKLKHNERKTNEPSLCSLLSPSKKCACVYSFVSFLEHHFLRYFSFLDTLNLFSFCSVVFMSFNKDLVFVIVTPVFWIFTTNTVFFSSFFLSFCFFVHLVSMHTHICF